MAQPVNAGKGVAFGLRYGTGGWTPLNRSELPVRSRAPPRDALDRCPSKGDFCPPLVIHASGTYVWGAWSVGRSMALCSVMSRVIVRGHSL